MRFVGSILGNLGVCRECSREVIEITYKFPTRNYKRARVAQLVRASPWYARAAGFVPGEGT